MHKEVLDSCVHAAYVHAGVRTVMGIRAGIRTGIRLRDAALQPARAPCLRLLRVLRVLRHLEAEYIKTDR